MSHDYDEDLERGGERRSRKNPRMRSDVSEASASEREKWERRQQILRQQEREQLDVLGDASVHPIPVDPKALETAASEEGQQKAAQQPDTYKLGGDGLTKQPRKTAAGAGVSVGSRAGGSTAGSRAAGNAAGSGAGTRAGASRTAASGSDGVLSPRAAAELAKKKKRRRMIAMIVAEFFALVFIFGYGFFARTMAKLQRDDSFEISEIKTNDIDVQSVETMKGYWTIAVFGVDSRDSTIKKSTNADVNIICNINRDTGEIKLVSVYRDSYLNVSDNGSYNKINQAYFLGGPEQAVSALNRNLDLHIQDYMSFNWKAVANAIDILGGVDIELSKAEFYYINSFITETVKATGIGSTQLKSAGMNHLDGVQAVAYGRLRLMDTDYARTERQRKVIAQAFEKAKKADPQTLYKVIGAVFPQVSTSIWVDDLMSNAKNISKFHLGETTGFPQARGDANMGKKGSCVIPQTLESNVVKLHEFLFGVENYTPSSTVKKISAKIAADTGMYKEGQYVDKVSTEGGVIQPPKTTASSDSKTDSSDKKEYEYVYQTDKNGKKVKVKVEKETDEDGEYITRETDEDGVVVETKKGTISEKPTTLETDEFGDVIETESSQHPGSTTESSVHPGLTETTTSSRPGATGETTTAAHPGSTSETTTSLRPGSTAETTAASRPTTNESTSSRPGSTTPTTAAASTTTDGPGSSNSGSQIQSFPGSTSGSSSTENPTVSQGPGSGASAETAPALSGVVAGPGQ